MPLPPKTRYSLIARLRDPHDAEAWNEFTEIYQPVIFKLCRSRGLQHADATDITQDVLGKIAIAIETFDLDRKQKNFRGWLYRITRNLVIDFLRKREKDPQVQFEAGLELALTTSPGQEDSAEFQRAFETQVFLTASKNVREKVREKTWSAFWLTEIDQVPVVQVSRRLGISVGTVYVARSRVLTRIKAAVKQVLSETSGEFASIHYLLDEQD